MLEGLVQAVLDDCAVSAWQELDGTWRAFFGSNAERDHAAETLRDNAPAPLDVTALDVPDEDWAARSQANLTPVRVGRVILTPPWGAIGPAAAEAAGALEVTIQPSMGFGTGHHASTRLCTALLQQIPVEGRSVLDVGTGSGVLAIVAERLGAGTILGIDNDADAIESARENLELNGLEHRIELKVGDFREVEARHAGIVTANLTGGLLVRGAAVIAASVEPGGHLIVSGVTLAEEADVTEAFTTRDLHLVARLGEDEWVGMLWERPTT